MSGAAYGYDPEQDDPDALKRPSDAEPPPNPDLKAPAGEPPEPEPAPEPAPAGVVDPNLPPDQEGPELARPEPPGGALSAQQLAAAATVPPPAGGDAVDQELARARAAEAGPPTIQRQQQQALDERQQLTDQAVEAEKKAQNAREKMALADAQEAERKVQAIQENARREQAIQAQANTLTQQWMDAKQQEVAKYQRMGLHDYWEDKPTINRVLAGLAMIAGSAGGRSPAENPGIQIVTGAIERDFRIQQANIAKQKENIALAEEGLQGALTWKQQALADNNLKKAAAFDAAAAQAVALKLRQGVPLAQAQSDAAIVALRQKATDVRQETLKAVHAANVQDAQLGQGEERIGIEREHLKIQQEDAETRKLLAEARARKLAGKMGGGTGIGGRSYGDLVAAMQAAAEKDGANLASVIQAGTAKGMSLKEQKAIAAQGKQIWDEYQKGAGAEKKAQGETVKKVENSMEKYRVEAVGTPKSAGPVKTLAQIEEMRETLDKAVKTGNSDEIIAAAVKAQEQAGTIMSGGKMTVGQMKILGEMKSAADELRSKIGHFTGKPQEGAGYVKRLGKLIDDAGNETANLVGGVRDRAIDEHLGPGGTADNPAAKRAFLNKSKGIFGQAKWKGQKLFEEQGGAGAQQGGGPPALTDQQRALRVKAQQTVKDPKADPQTKRDAQAFLDATGG